MARITNIIENAAHDAWQELLEDRTTRYVGALVAYLWALVAIVTIVGA